MLPGVIMLPMQQNALRSRVVNTPTKVGAHVPVFRMFGQHVRYSYVYVFVSACSIHICQKHVCMSDVYPVYVWCPTCVCVCLSIVHKISDLFSFVPESIFPEVFLPSTILQDKLKMLDNI